MLRQADAAGVGTIGFRVAGEEDLDRMKARFEALGLPVRWAGNDMLGQGRTLRMQDPLGFTIDYYAEVTTVPWLVQQYHLHKGPSPTRIDHVNVLTPDAQAGYDWYTQELGFGCAEYTEVGAAGPAHLGELAVPQGDRTRYRRHDRRRTRGASCRIFVA